MARPALSSASNPAVRLARELGTPHGRRKRGLVIVEGIRAIEAAAAGAGGAGGWVVLATARALGMPRGRALAAALEGRGAAVHEVAEAAYRSFSHVEAPQGIALIMPPPRAGLPEALAADLVLVADGVQDPGNLGSLLRCARAFGAGAVITTRGTADAANPKAVRAAAGAWPGVPVAAGVDAARVARALEEDGRTVLVADAGRGRDFRDPLWRGRVALVVGSEGGGPSAAFLRHRRVRIPLDPAVESLNVAAAAAILLAEAARQRAASHR